MKASTRYRLDGITADDLRKGLSMLPVSAKLTYCTAMLNGTLSLEWEWQAPVKEYPPDPGWPAERGGQG